MGALAVGLQHQSKRGNGEPGATAIQKERVLVRLDVALAAESEVSLEICLQSGSKADDASLSGLEK